MQSVYWTGHSGSQVKSGSAQKLDQVKVGLRSKCLRSRSRSGQNVGLRSENGSRVKKQVTGQKLGLGVKK